MSDNTPGWQADPTGKHDHRYWDGSAWTEHVADAGVAGVDPYEAVTPEAPVPEEPVAEGESAAEVAPQDESAAEEPTPVAEPAGEALAEDTTLVDQEVPPPDTTDAYPAVSGEPAAWPAAPEGPDAPAPPPPYVPTDAASASGGKKKGLLIGGGILAAVAVVAIALSAFGGDDDDTSSVQAQLASKLQQESDGELTDDQANCLAGLLVDEAGEGAFKNVDFDADEAPPEVLRAFLAVGATKVAQECGIDEADANGAPVPDGSYGSDAALDALYDSCADGDFADCDLLYLDAPVDSEYRDFGDTCGERNEPSSFCVDLYGDGEEEDDGDDAGAQSDSRDLPTDYQETLATTFGTTLGLDSDQAECLAGKVVAAIEGGTVSEEEAATGFVEFLSGCDISLEEIGGN
jgi:hypothetical protein